MSHNYYHVIHLEHEPIVERIIHRLVRKHIAGTTMESALDAAKDLGGKNISPSITFLSSNVPDRAKAKYITTTYTELVRRIARSGIKASVHVPLEQIGGTIEEGAALENLKAITALGAKYGIFLWVDPDGIGSSMMSSVSGVKGIGLAVSEADADKYARYSDSFDNVKISFREYKPKSKSDAAKRIAALRKTYSGNLVLSYIPENLLSDALKPRGKSAAAVEFNLGYSEKKVNDAIKKGAKVSVLVPFGKDWIKYAMNNVPEGYMRFVAGRLLKDGDESVA